MKETELNGKQLKIMEEINDEKYGRVWNAFYDHRKVYIVEGKIIESQEIIDELDNKYGVPVELRNIVF